MPSASLAEWIWGVAALLSTVLAVRSLRDAQNDEAFLTATGINGPRRLVADANIRQEGFRLASSLVMVAAAVTSLFLSPPPPPFSEVPQTMVTVVAWIAVAGAMSLASWLDRSSRRKLAKFVGETTPKDPATGLIVEKGAEALPAPNTTSNRRAVSDRRHE
jgi:hypothetical protein